MREGSTSPRLRSPRRVARFVAGLSVLVSMSAACTAVLGDFSLGDASVGDASLGRGDGGVGSRRGDGGESSRRGGSATSRGSSTAAGTTAGGSNTTTETTTSALGPSAASTGVSGTNSTSGSNTGPSSSASGSGFSTTFSGKSGESFTISVGGSSTSSLTTTTTTTPSITPPISTTSSDHATGSSETSATSAMSDAGCYCACLGTSVSYCDDFDDPSTALANWMPYQSGGTEALDMFVSYSPPTCLSSTIDAGQNVGGTITQTFAVGTATTLTLSFELQVSSCTGIGTAIVAQIQVGDYSLDVLVSTKNGLVLLPGYLDLTDPTPYGTGLSLADGWNEVSLAYQSATGASSETLSVGESKVRAPLDSMLETPALNGVALQLGLSSTAGYACAVEIDNVTFDWR